MTITLAILVVVLLSLLIFVLLKINRLEKLSRQKDGELATLKQDSEASRQHYESELSRILSEAELAVGNAQKQIFDQLTKLQEESEQARRHYEMEARKAQEAANDVSQKALKDLEAFRKYESLHDAEAQTKQVLADAIAEATALRKEAATLLEQSRTTASKERSEVMQKAADIQRQAENVLNQASREASYIIEKAHKKAEEIAADAYTALREKQTLEQATTAIRNVIEGYGDRYVIPTRSLLDDLASEFGHTEAGRMLTMAREHTRRMVENGISADCDYTESVRRLTAINFVTDAFNGRVDAILTEVQHDNYGTLEQQIRDSFALVNLNGKAFRNARILQPYLDSRLSELKWAVIVQELKLKQREEQRRIKEQIREEEKARREMERVIQETQKEEEILKRALEKARLEAAQATAEQKAKLESQVAMLNQRLAEAEAKNQRALSMAQQTRKGNVYVISNVGSFGEDVFKIGMTRRLDPIDRIYELGDASVPFEFDVHAMISSDDAPALENLLHNEFDDLRVNKVNYRKEFFRLPLERLRTFVASKGIEASFTLVAEAKEFRETQAVNKMSPEERAKYFLNQTTKTASISVPRRIDGNGNEG